MAAAVAAAARRQVTALFLSSAVRHQSSQSTSLQQGLVAKTSLTSPPWPEVKLPDPVEEAKYHTEVVQKVNKMIATGQYGRLFAVVHFASKQWKITSEDLIMMDNVLEAECGDRIRMEKVLLVGADDFTLIGRPLLGPVAFESITSKPSSSAPADSNHCHGARTEQQHPLLRCSKCLGSGGTCLRPTKLHLCSVSLNPGDFGRGGSGGGGGGCPGRMKGWWGGAILPPSHREPSWSQLSDTG
ncbi:39S ribosomal protein L21, mitochondrial isoform X1 [Rissa tridactyla]|uniref:39S ribosomal protein L21, mitochondrial isoform X1 n=1 Tax=Rissa tridactyla TaxID=75485 RepID=UPI0023BB09BD|nr:39S ribosomal protein L21, mitochondrial isoform X1 [Rissa tridactyla]